MRHGRYRTSGAGRADSTWLSWACVYVIPTRSTTTSRTEVGYIGQSAGVHRRDVVTGLPLARLAEHRDKQWWADLIVHPYMYLVWETGPDGCTQRQLDEMERWFIRNGAPPLDFTGSFRPRYNWTHNEDNPNVVPPSEQERQARARGYQPPRPSKGSPRTSQPSWERQTHRAQPVTPAFRGVPVFLIFFLATLVMIALCVSRL